MTRPNPVAPSSGLVPLLAITLAWASAATSGRAALDQDAILYKLTPAEIEAQLPNENPGDCYLYATRLVKNNDYPDALRWFYIGQLRYRVFLQSHPEEDSSPFMAMNQSLGKVLYRYGALHQDQWLAAIDGALGWDDAHDNPLTPKDQFAAPYAKQRAALVKLRAFIVAHGPQLKMAANGGAADPVMRKFNFSEEVRGSSKAGDSLFHDLLNAPGGIGMVDRALFPNAKMREIVRIDVIVPYDNIQTGVERWTINHDGGKPVSYLVRMIPDGRGGTTFAVSRDGG